MNLKDLEYLVALAEEGHFRRAAERCFVSQPTLSGQIKKLEDRITSYNVCYTKLLRWNSAGEMAASVPSRVSGMARISSQRRAA